MTDTSNIPKAYMQKQNYTVRYTVISSNQFDKQ